MSDTVEILADEFKLGYPLTYDVVYNRGKMAGISECLEIIKNNYRMDAIEKIEKLKGNNND